MRNLSVILVLCMLAYTCYADSSYSSSSGGSASYSSGGGWAFSSSQNTNNGVFLGSCSYSRNGWKVKITYTLENGQPKILSSEGATDEVTIDKLKWCLKNAPGSFF